MRIQFETELTFSPLIGIKKKRERKAGAATAPWITFLPKSIFEKGVKTDNEGKVVHLFVHMRVSFGYTCIHGSSLRTSARFYIMKCIIKLDYSDKAFAPYLRRIYSSRFAYVNAKPYDDSTRRDIPSSRERLYSYLFVKRRTLFYLRNIFYWNRSATRGIINTYSHLSVITVIFAFETLSFEDTYIAWPLFIDIILLISRFTGLFARIQKLQVQ